MLEVRATYVDGKIVHGYWRVKETSAAMSAATRFGSTTDYNIPADVLGPFVSRGRSVHAFGRFRGFERVNVL